MPHFAGISMLPFHLERMELQSPTATPDQCAVFAKKVDINRLGNNPTKLTVEDVEALYRKILVHK